MSGVEPLLPLYAFMAWREGEKVPFYFSIFIFIPIYFIEIKYGK
jgi:hypothetical protein